MLCTNCRVFSGVPTCASCKTHSRIGSLLRSGQLVAIQEAQVLAALRNCAGAISDLIEGDLGPFGESQPAAGAKQRTRSPEIGAWPLKTSEEKKETSEAHHEEDKPTKKEAKPGKEKAKKKPEGRKKDKRRVKPPPKEDRSPSPAGRKAPERASKRARSPEKEDDEEHEREIQAKEEERSDSERGGRREPSEREVRREPRKFGLEPIRARGSVGDHFQRGEDRHASSSRPPEPRGPPPRRDTRPEERNRASSRRDNPRERGGRHYQRGVDYWKWVKTQKKK